MWITVRSLFMSLIAQIWFGTQVVHVSRRDNLWEAICTRSLAVGERNRKKTKTWMWGRLCMHVGICGCVSLHAWLHFSCSLWICEVACVNRLCSAHRLENIKHSLHEQSFKMLKKKRERDEKYQGGMFENCLPVSFLLFSAASPPPHFQPVFVAQMSKIEADSNIVMLKI